MSKQYKYTTTKAFDDSIGRDHTIVMARPSTIEEATSPEFGGGTPYFPNVDAVLAKAVAQLNISAVHRAADWAKKENVSRAKDGKAPVSVAEVQDKVASFRYSGLRERGTGDGKRPSTAEVREALAERDEARAARTKLALAIAENQVPKSTVAILLSTNSITQAEIDDARELLKASAAASGK